MPIKIDFLANVQSFLRGTQDAGKALEKVADSLDDVVEDGGDGTKRLERDFRELADTVKRETDQAAGSMKRNFGEGTTAAKRDLKELGSEAKQNAAETFSSFDGSAQSFADGIQGTLGGVVSSLGPIGAAAGAAGALGIGLIMAAMDQSEQTAEETRAKVAELGAEYIETGELGKASIEFIVDALKDLATESDESKTDLKDLRKVADDSRSSFKDLAQAYAGNTDKLRELYAAGQKRAEQLEAERIATNKLNTTAAEASVVITAKRDAQNKYNEYLKESVAVADAAAEAEANYLASGGPEMERKAALISQINDAYDDTATSIGDYINAESGVLDVSAYITAMEARKQALADYQTALASSGLSEEAKSFLNEQGADAAAQFLAGYVSATPEQRAALNTIWTEAGREDSAAYTGTLATGFMGKTVKGPAVQIDPPNADTIVNNLQGQLRNRSVSLRVRTVDQKGRDVD